MYEFHFGIKYPALIIKTLDGVIIAKGLMDVPYDLRESSTYAVEVRPLDDFEKFELSNISNQLVITRIPLLQDFSIEYKIPPKTKVYIPVTKWSDYFLRTADNLGGLVYKKYAS